MATPAGTSGAVTRRNVMLEDRTHEALRQMAHDERTSISEIVRAALEKYKPLRAYLQDQS